MVSPVRPWSRRRPRGCRGGRKPLSKSSLSPSASEPRCRRLCRHDRCPWMAQRDRYLLHARCRRSTWNRAAPPQPVSKGPGQDHITGGQEGGGGATVPPARSHRPQAGPTPRRSADLRAPPSRPPSHARSCPPRWRRQPSMSWVLLAPAASSPSWPAWACFGKAAQEVAETWNNLPVIPRRRREIALLHEVPKPKLEPGWCPAAAPGRLRGSGRRP
jgi:hypothetical protein